MFKNNFGRIKLTDPKGCPTCLYTLSDNLYKCYECGAMTCLSCLHVDILENAKILCAVCRIPYDMFRKING